MITAIVGDTALQSIVLLTLIAGLGDLATGVIAALRSGAFSVDKVATYIGGHLLMRALPIILVATLASLLSAAVAGIPAPPVVLTGGIAAAWAAAWAGVIAYVLETLGSLQTNIRTASSPNA